MRLDSLIDSLNSMRIPFDIQDTAVHIEGSEEGFNIDVRDDGEEVTVYFAGWHEHFTDMSEVKDVVAFGLSEECRVEVLSRGGFDYRWTLQARTASGWKTDSVTALLFFPFWRRKKVRHLTNNILGGPRSPEGTT